MTHQDLQNHLRELDRLARISNLLYLAVASMIVSTAVYAICKVI